MRIKFTEDCHGCGTEMAFEVLLLDEIKNDTIEYPVNLLEQQTWECPKCDLKHFTGDIEILTEKDLEE